MSQPTPLPELDEPLTAPERSWRVILHDDDITPLDLVIMALQKSAGLSLEVAEMVAVEAHTEGSAVVKRGLEEEDARIMCGSLKRLTRIPGECPGVYAHAEKDD